MPKLQLDRCVIMTNDQLHRCVTMTSDQRRPRVSSPYDVEQCGHLFESVFDLTLYKAHYYHEV